MVLELADLRIQPGRQAEFEAALRRGVEEVIARAEGFRAYRVENAIESPERYLLLIEWETLESHTAGFRQSPAFARWREIVGPFFAAPTQVEHFECLAAPARA
jgi:heme-degrading monooxygenase HmoA